MREYVLTNFKEYKEKQYNEKLNNHLDKYIDYDELSFIESEIKFFENCYNTASISGDYTLVEDPYHDITFKTIYSRDEGLIDNFEFKTIIDAEILNFNIETDGFDLLKSEQLALTYKKILSFLNDKKEQLTKQPLQLNEQQTKTLNWQGTPLQFTELIKALIKSNMISPELSEKERFERLRQFFNIDTFNENDKLKDIRKRTNTTTPFIHILETSLNNWINKND